MNIRTALRISSIIMLATTIAPHVVAAKPLESKRMERAKDLIADEEWVRAIEELNGAIADQKEPNKDEALFWLAHSQNQARDSAAAIETIRRLERDFPASRWVKPARSLRIEIAQRLQRNDVLWYTAAPPPPPPAPRLPQYPSGERGDASGAPRSAGAAHRRVQRAGCATGTAAPPARRVAPPVPPPAWIPQGYLPDMDMRIQALASLIRTDAPKVIPMLRDIALESGNADEARRALFVLAQSGRPEARMTVVEVAKTGPEQVRVAAVRELGRVGGPAVATELLQVYSTADERVKYQVVSCAGQRDAAPALLRIAQSETDRRLRDVAIVTLGEAGGRQQLAALYAKAAADAKRAIVTGLFNARADDELIRIAGQESNAEIRRGGARAAAAARHAQSQGIPRRSPVIRKDLRFTNPRPGVRGNPRPLRSSGTRQLASGSQSCVRYMSHTIEPIPAAAGAARSSSSSTPLSR